MSARVLQRLAQVALGLALKLVVEHAEVEPHQRHVPRTGDGFGRHALAGALHSQQQHALGRVDAQLGRIAAEGHAAQLEPALEAAQAADVAEVAGVHFELEQAALAQRVALEFQHALRVFETDYPVVAY